jgi:hypothetical protein
MIFRAQCGICGTAVECGARCQQPLCVRFAAHEADLLHQLHEAQEANYELRQINANLVHADLEARAARMIDGACDGACAPSAELVRFAETIEPSAVAEAPAFTFHRGPRVNYTED